MQRMTKGVIWAVLIFLGVAVPRVWGAFPRTLSFQGVLNDGNGNPVADGNYDITFRIYTMNPGPVLLWEESQTLLVTDARFDALLGNITSLDGLAFDAPYWLAYQVESDAEMTPWTELGAVPFSMSARTVEDGAITSPKIAGGTVLRSLNSLTDDVNLVAGANVTITPVGNDLEIAASGGTSPDNDWNVSGSDMSSAVSGNVGIGTPTPSAKLEVAGVAKIQDRLEIGNPTQDGALEVYKNGALQPIVRTGSSVNGGSLYVQDEKGAPVVTMEPDTDGAGGFLAVSRADGLPGIYSEGNFAGSNQPRFGVFGTTQTFLVHMNSVGNSAVQMPEDAVSALEILDEPGVASDVEPNSTNLTGAVQVLASKTLTAPSSGFVLVMGQLEASLGHTQGSVTWATFGISNVPNAFPSNQDVLVGVPANAGSGIYYYSVSLHGVFSVNAGQNQFYLLGQPIGGSTIASDRGLTLVFLPTSYGSVESP